MKMRELIKNIEHDTISPAASDSQLGFYCPQEKYGVYPEPYHINDSDSHEPSSSVEFTTTLFDNHTPTHNGWVIPAPFDMTISITDDSTVHIQTDANTDLTHWYSKRNTLTSTTRVIELDIPWIINTDPGTGVLCTHPITTGETPFTIIPNVTDDHNGIIHLSIACIIKQQSVHIAAGTPLVQLHPVDTNAFDVTATIGTLSETQQ